jgi:hypothetical protein
MRGEVYHPPKRRRASQVLSKDIHTVEKVFEEAEKVIKIEDDSPPKLFGKPY